MNSKWVDKILLEPNLYILTPISARCDDINLDWDFKNKVIYGPAVSKRFGLSLGINLYPNKRVCLFDCIYCCADDSYTGYATERLENTGVLKRLKNELNSVLSNESLIKNLESIAFCGNGDPLLSQYFSEAVDILEEWVQKVRETFEKRIKTGVISNLVLNDKNIEALRKLDEIYVKLDAVDDKIVRLINRPKNPHFRIDKYIESVNAIAKILGDKMKISTAVVFNKEDVNNYSHLKTDYSFAIREIHVKDIYLHNINPPTPLPIKRAPLSEMIDIARIIKKNSKKNVFVLWETYFQAIVKNQSK